MFMKHEFGMKHENELKMNMNMNMEGNMSGSQNVIKKGYKF